MTTTPVLVTTKHRGVFGGLLDNDVPRDATTLNLTDARMAIRFGTTKGVLELAHTGPTSSSRISAPADITLQDVTMIADITPAAWAKWVED
ncbi:MAG: DUF6948 domain-containing protein [Candidatus Neomicrothrix subdominans]